MQRLKYYVKLLISKKYRRWVAAAAIVLTVLLIGRFFIVNPEYIRTLRRVPPTVILLIIFLNIPAMMALAWAYSCMLSLCGKTIPAKEQALLTAYSSIANFFGPMQSGPGVRAVYLKSRYAVRLRDYMVATLIYYAFYASFSALFLVGGSRPWWQAVLAVLGAAGFSVIVIRWFTQRGRSKAAEHLPQFRLRTVPLIGLAAATFLQIVFITAYFYVELRAVNPHIGVGQAISYTGAANFSLFVSITPDAVGFREAFLVFSQQLHHISVANILAANIIDRGAYVIYLLLLFVFVLAIHAKDRLRVPVRKQTAEE